MVAHVLGAMHLPSPACRHLWKFIQVGNYRPPVSPKKNIDIFIVKRKTLLKYLEPADADRQQTTCFCKRWSQGNDL